MTGAGVLNVRSGIRLRLQEKRKGLQLALEPLNGQGIAGYVPEPELWMRPRGNDYVVPWGSHPGRTYML